MNTEDVFGDAQTYRNTYHLTPLVLLQHHESFIGEHMTDELRASLRNDSECWERPVFLLGTGRCGSTTVQQVLTYSSEVWMWGEHGGILESLIKCYDDIRNSPGLTSYHFPHVRLLPQERLAEGQTVTAWMNGFTASDIDDLERSAILALFTKMLPAGYSRWGFKEIRYGPQSRVPERMIELFPKCRIIHLVRHPFATAESSIRAWNPEIPRRLSAGDSGAVGDLRQSYMDYLTRWTIMTNFYRCLEIRHSQNVRTFRLEDVITTPADLLQFIQTEPLWRPTSAAKIFSFHSNRASLPSNAYDRCRELIDNLNNEVWELVSETARALQYHMDSEKSGNI